MAEMTDDEIAWLAKLCRIKCSQERREQLRQDLHKILGYIEQLRELDTTGVEPCNHVLETVVNVMRTDEVGETLSRKTFLDNSPDQVGGMIRVPPVLKQKS